MKKVLCIMIPIFIVVAGGIGGLFYYLGQRSTPANIEIGKNDKAFIKAIEKSIEKRYDIAEKYEKSNDENYDVFESYKEGIDAEKELLSFESAVFDSPRLQQLALDYINGLKLQEEALSYQSDSTKFTGLWNDGYNQRGVALVAMHDEFGVKVPEKTLESFKSVAKTVVEQEEQEKIVEELVNSIIFEKVKTEYSYSTYATTVENTTEYEFDSLNLDISLIKDGVVQETTYASAQNWKPGQKVKLDFMTDCEFDNYTIDYDYYIKEE